MNETNNPKVFIFTTNYIGTGCLFNDNNCSKNTDEKLKFSKSNHDTTYYQINGKKIYAIKPLDNTNKSKNLIETLIDIFAKNTNEIFLLLHDKDIYSEGKRFEVLDSKEIDKLTDKPNVNILVFQHESSRVTDLLKSDKLDKIEDRIESLFKNPLSQWLDYECGFEEYIINFDEVKNFLKTNYSKKITEEDLTFLKKITPFSLDTQKFNELIEKLQ